MTGYARVEETFAVERLEQMWSWGWELKSVNARGLDLRCRVPAGFERLDAQARKILSDGLSRGSVSAQLSVQCKKTRSALGINRDLLENILKLQANLEKEGTVYPSPPRLDVLLTVRGMIDDGHAETLDADERAALEAAALAGLSIVLDQLVAMRAEEGRRLHAVFEDQLSMLDGLLGQARSQTDWQVGICKARLREQLNEILEASPPVAEERLAQELALIATKADVREEIERLNAHLEACRDLLKTDVPVGRRLDFLCQELNREANTICSKSAALALTTIGLELKSVIEQFREQIQNVE